MEPSITVSWGNSELCVESVPTCWCWTATCLVWLEGTVVIEVHHADHLLVVISLLVVGMMFVVAFPWCQRRPVAAVIHSGPSRGWGCFSRGYRRSWKWGTSCRNRRTQGPRQLNRSLGGTDWVKESYNCEGCLSCLTLCNRLHMTWKSTNPISNSQRSLV